MVLYSHVKKEIQQVLHTKGVIVLDINVFNAFYINLYSSLLLLVLLVILYIKRDIYNFSGKIFKYMIILNIVLSLLEGATLFFNGVDDSFARFMHYSLNFIVFLFTPLIGSLWAIYLDHKITKSLDHIKKNYYYLLPFIIGGVLLVINFFTPVLFSISADNEYTREPLMKLNGAMLILLLFYIVYFAYINRKNIDKRLLYGAALFLVFPALGGIIQMIFYGVSTIYSMFALGIFSTYIALETMGTSRDSLTGLFTRVKANEYINELLYKSGEFGVIMIDLDDFKNLNDNHGHTEGDKLLIRFGKVLSEVFFKESIVSRFGGDEFLIIKNNFHISDFDQYKKKIYEELKIEHDSNEIYEGFKFSIGCSVYEGGSKRTGEELIIEADNNMYANKAENKNFKRRKSDR